MTEIRPRDVFQSLDLLAREQAREQAIQDILSLLHGIRRAMEADAIFSRVRESANGQTARASLTTRQRRLIDRLLDQAEFDWAEMQALICAGRVLEAHDRLAQYAARRGDVMNLFRRIMSRIAVGQDAADVGSSYIERGSTITDLDVERDPTSFLMTHATKTSRGA